MGSDYSTEHEEPLVQRTPKATSPITQEALPKVVTHGNHAIPASKSILEEALETTDVEFAGKQSPNNIIPDEKSNTDVNESELLSKEVDFEDEKNERIEKVEQKTHHSSTIASNDITDDQTIIDSNPITNESKSENTEDQKQPIIDQPKIAHPPIFDYNSKPMTHEYECKLKEFFQCSFPINIAPEVFRLHTDSMNLRRYFHANPELSWKEENTALNIARYCRTLGLKVKENVAKTGVISVIYGGYSDGPCILLRAEMDALPIQEMNDCSFKSVVDNVSHACGHDCHLAILLTVARVLSQPSITRHLHGCIKFIFQPAEEGGAGAKHMIDAGVLEEDKELNCPKVDQVYGLHTWSYAKLGKVVCVDGELMAGSSSIHIIVRSQVGRNVGVIDGSVADGGQPNNCHSSDVVLVITQLVLQLHSIVCRDLSPTMSGVLTVGMMNVGSKHENSKGLIANYGEIEGTMRYFQPSVCLLMKQRIGDICRANEIAFNVGIEVKYAVDAYPATINHKLNAEIVRRAAGKVLPADGCVLKYGKIMAAEDFSFFLNERPGAFFFVGCAAENRDNEIFAHHTSTFKVNEKVLSVGAQIFVNLIFELLADKVGNDCKSSDEELQEMEDYNENIENVGSIEMNHVIDDGIVDKPSTVDLIAEHEKPIILD